MLSRRKRKRLRRKAEATANGPETQGGWGPGAPVSRSDLALLRTAVRERWPVSAEIRSEILNRLFAELESLDVRMTLAVAKTLVAMDAANMNTRG